jgi:hypothetical protein
VRTHQHLLILDGCVQWPTTGRDLRHLLAAVGRRPQLRELRFEMEAGEESYLLVVLLPQLRNLRELYLEAPFGEDFELPWVRSSIDRAPAPSQRPAIRPPAICTWRQSCRCPLPATAPRAPIPDSQPCPIAKRLAALRCLLQVAAALLPRLQVLRLRNPSALPDCIYCLVSLTKLAIHDPDGVASDQPVDLPPSFTKLRRLQALEVHNEIGEPPSRATLGGLQMLAALPGLRTVEMWCPSLDDLSGVQASGSPRA